MPRGAKVEKAETKHRRFMDRRSFVGQDGHEYLRGLDVSKRRDEVFERDRGICQQCVREGFEPIDSYCSWTLGQMHHRQGGLVGRCDCLHNLEWICWAHHRDKHVRPKWTKDLQASSPARTG